MNWLKRNYWRIVLAIAVGIVIYLVANPAFAALHKAPRFPEHAPVCEQSVSNLDTNYLVAQLNVERHAAYDTVLVFRVVVDRVERFVVVTAKNGCVVGIGA